MEIMEIDVTQVKFTVDRGQHDSGTNAIFQAMHLSRTSGNEPVFILNHDQDCVDILENEIKWAGSRGVRILSPNNIASYSGRFIDGDSWTLYLNVAKEETGADRLFAEVLQEIILEEIEDFKLKEERILKEIDITESRLSSLNIRLSYTQSEIKKRREERTK